eukprot:jgi/Ulvmu1/12580/UM092_0010.1
MRAQAMPCVTRGLHFSCACWSYLRPRCCLVLVPNLGPLQSAQMQTRGWQECFLQTCPARTCFTADEVLIGGVWYSLAAISAYRVAAAGDSRSAGDTPQISMQRLRMQMRRFPVTPCATHHSSSTAR